LTQIGKPARAVDDLQEFTAVPHVIGRTDESTDFRFRLRTAEDKLWRLRKIISAVGRVVIENFGEGL
jgi:hypothetical protein